ncbi:hypothetical protein [Streptomyces sp. HUAS ZL42]|uniref:hypothetical protein n=1 Tax=Streptomyces sp. HUAS ZL42 TaxID=3231715 RepID=UPI00345EE4EF
MRTESAIRCRRGLWDWLAQPTTLFGGVYDGVRGVVRAVLAEWPLVVAALPTTLLLYGAGLGWWRSTGIEYVAFGINTVVLLGWGLLASRAAGRTWRRAVRIGGTDALLGVAVAVDSTLLK